MNLSRPVFHKLLLVWLAAVTVWLCARNIGAPLRADDVWSLRAVALPWREMLRALAADVHPPLYFLMLAPWLRLFGDGEVALRFLSVLFHLLAVAAVWRLARRFLQSEPALLCATIYAVTPIALLSAELVRMYSLLSLLGVLSTTAWFDLVSAQRRRPHHWLAWIFINILGSFCHLWFFCLLLGQGLSSLILHRRLLPRLSLGFAASLLPYGVLWLPKLLGQLQASTEAAAWLKPPSFALVPEFAVMQIGLMVFCLPVAAALMWERRAGAGGVPAWLLILILGTLLPPLLVSFFKPFFHVRFTVVATHLLALAMGAWLARVFDSRFTAALALIAVIFSIGLAARGESCDSQAAARYLARHVRDGDTVIYTSLSRPAIDHYLRRVHPVRQWKETSFPAEIDAHPGYEGSITDPRRRPALEAEARALVDGLAPGARVFFFSGTRPETDQPLLEQLDGRLTPLPDLSLACQGEGVYFNRIRAYQVP